MGSISDIAAYLIENAKSLAIEIVEQITQQMKLELAKEQKATGTVFYVEFIKFLGESLICEDGEVPPDFIAWNRMHGEREANMGKKSSDVLVFYPTVRGIFIQSIAKICLDHGLSTEELIFVNKRINFTLDIGVNEIIRSFDHFKEKIMKAVQEEMNELSAPIVPVHEGVAILPLIGTIDTYRAKYILEKVIPKVAQLKIENLIIDFSGIHTIDTMVTKHIFKMHDVLRLLGIHATLTGIRPELARTVTEIGMDLPSITSYTTVQKALEIIKKK
ncbi:STAS domain-containing protein [Aneurinibacillus terranovensis]|uniref:STAS domain-containing protein n=1 Tax=Aneurinibacillus terranovensis TaxID=278991 RepID=UPI00040885E7|nr:STAS domain-containing protein [Aneurinibacillus terranovensis]